MEGNTITMTNGYPSEATIDDTLAGLDGFVYDDTASPIVFSKSNDGTTAIANCDVTYTAAAAAGAAPTVVVDTTGC